MTATDPWGHTVMGTTGCADDAFAITPDDDAELAQVVRGIWVGGAGNLKVQTFGGTTVTLVGLAAGSATPPLRIRKVFATDTTATSLVGLP